MQYIVCVYYIYIYYYVREFFASDGSNTIQYYCYIIVAHREHIRPFCVPPTGGQMTNNTRVYTVRRDEIIRDELARNRTDLVSFEIVNCCLLHRIKPAARVIG